MKNMEVFLHLQNRLPDLLDHRNTKLAVFFDGAQHSLAGPADFAIRSGRGAGLDVRKDGADDGVVFLDGAKFSGVDRDHDLGQTNLVAEGPDGVDGIAAGKKEIAGRLYLSEGTVRNYISSILRKLELRDRTQLAIWAVQNQNSQPEADV